MFDESELTLPKPKDEDVLAARDFILSKLGQSGWWTVRELARSAAEHFKLSPTQQNDFYYAFLEAFTALQGEEKIVHRNGLGWGLAT